jgi:two-component system, NarL family, response regulator NreC
MAGLHDLTFVIADDHPLIREAVKTILEEKGFQVIGEASDGEEAVRLCRELEPDIAVLDISMPRLNGLEAARQIKQGRPSTTIILLTMHPEDPYIAQTYRLGITGYVVKSKTVHSLLDAIDAVCRGEIYLSPACGQGDKRRA